MIAIPKQARCGANWQSTNLMQPYSDPLNEAVQLAKIALEVIPKEQAYVLGTAATVPLLSAQAAGDSVEHMHQMEQLLLDDGGVQSATATRILGTFAWMACYAGEWEKARGLAEYVLKVVEHRENRLIFGWGHLYLAGITINRTNWMRRRCILTRLCKIATTACIGAAPSAAWPAWA